MSNSNSFKYPLYIISKGRSEACLTANFLVKDQIDFKIAVEPQEYDAYYKYYGDKVVKLPFSNLGLGSYPARNWCWEDSIKNGFDKHWILDDNIRSVKRLYKGVRITTNPQYAFKFIEDLTANYNNIAMSGMNYEMFINDRTNRPIVKNHHIYSNFLIDNSLPFRWRLRYNEDTDLNLQALKLGLCIFYTNIFVIQKMRTMTMKGGNSDKLYKDNGRLLMARMLESVHPDVVSVKWKFKRPQHHVDWHRFKQPLSRSENYKTLNLNDYGHLNAVGNVKSSRLRELMSTEKTL